MTTKDKTYDMNTYDILEQMGYLSITDEQVDAALVSARDCGLWCGVPDATAKIEVARALIRHHDHLKSGGRIAWFSVA